MNDIRQAGDNSSPRHLDARTAKCDACSSPLGGVRGWHQSNNKRSSSADFQCCGGALSDVTWSDCPSAFILFLFLPWVSHYHCHFSLWTFPAITVPASIRPHITSNVLGARKQDYLVLEAIRIGIGASPAAQWLSSCAPLRRPRVSPVWILGTDMAPLIKPCWGGVPHATTGRTHN